MSPIAIKDIQRTTRKIYLRFSREDVEKCPAYIPGAPPG
jgi:hypothetical protein